MSMAVKPGYVNPLTMMGQKKTGLTPASNAIKKNEQNVKSNGSENSEKSEKRDDVRNLETEQQTLQNNIVMLSSTTDAAGSSETQEALKQELEKVSSALKTAKNQEARMVDVPAARKNFDTYEHVKDQEESAGLYEKLKDKKDTYSILFSPYSEQQ